MKKKVLIAYTNSRNEEKRIALELYNYLKKDRINVELLDCTPYFNFKRLFNIYKDVKNLGKIINKHDFVISTNYYINEAIIKCKKKNIINSNIRIIYVFSNLSYSKYFKSLNNADYFAVNNNYLQKELIKKNVDKDKIIFIGAPTIDKNIKLESKELTLKKYSLNNNKPIYLMLANGQDYTFEYFKHLVKKNFDINIVFISGNNKTLTNKCEKFVYDNDVKNVLIQDYTKDLYNIINISDIVITKPGTNILFECAYFKKTTILLPGLNLEERKNSHYMIKNHYAINVTTPLNLIKKVKFSLKYKFIIKSIQNKLDRISTVDNYKSIVDIIKR